jgi:hypothetical protein
MQIRLSDEDRVRLNCPEWLTVDLEHYPIELAEAIEAAGGDWTTFLSRGVTSAVRTRVWVGLREAGVEVDLPTLTFDLVGMETRASDPGKAPSLSDDDSTSTTSSSSVE